MWALATGADEGEDTKGRRGGANERGATIARRRNEGCRLYPINYLPINLVELRYGSPWLAMSRTDCLNCTLERATHRPDTGGDVKRQIITSKSCADAGVGKKRKPAGLRVGGEVPAHLPSGNGHDRRENTTSTPTRSVQENSNVRFNFYWEVA